MIPQGPPNGKAIAWSFPLGEDMPRCTNRRFGNNGIHRQYVKQCLLREELEYDTYVGENYKAEEYGINHWKHDPAVSDVLHKARRAK